MSNRYTITYFAILSVFFLFHSCASIKNYEINDDDENFLAEAFIDPLMQSISFWNPSNTDIYFYTDTDYWSYYFLSDNPKRYSEIFCREIEVCDENITRELGEYVKPFLRIDSIVTDINSKWNGKAKVFHQKRYNNVHFISNYEDVLILKAKGANIFYIDKPIYTHSKEYALIAINTHNTVGNEAASSQYHHLFKKIDGKWVEIGKYLTIIS